MYVGMNVDGEVRNVMHGDLGNVCVLQMVFIGARTRIAGAGGRISSRTTVCYSLFLYAPEPKIAP